VRPDRNATVIDGQGKFEVPGLWDMRIHLRWTTQSALPLLEQLESPMYETWEDDED
jgi:predicted amidohydrolase YtcJ